MTDRSVQQSYAVGRVIEDDSPDSAAFDRLPEDGTDQVCAICTSTAVTWVHPMARSKVGFREFGKGHTLPTYWCLCTACEALYQDGHDEQLAQLSAVSWARSPEPAEWYPGGVRPFTDDEWFEQVVRQPIAVFRRADMGARRLSQGGAVLGASDGCV